MESTFVTGLARFVKKGQALNTARPRHFGGELRSGISKNISG